MAGNQQEIHQEAQPGLADRATVSPGQQGRERVRRGLRFGRSAVLRTQAAVRPEGTRVLATILRPADPGATPTMRSATSLRRVLRWTSPSEAAGRLRRPTLISVRVPSRLSNQRSLSLTLVGGEERGAAAPPLLAGSGAAGVLRPAWPLASSVMSLSPDRTHYGTTNDLSLAGAGPKTGQARSPVAWRP